MNSIIVRDILTIILALMLSWVIVEWWYRYRIVRRVKDIVHGKLWSSMLVPHVMRVMMISYRPARALVLVCDEKMTYHLIGYREEYDQEVVPVLRESQYSELSSFFLGEPLWYLMIMTEEHDSWCCIDVIVSHEGRECTIPVIYDARLGFYAKKIIYDSV